MARRARRRTGEAITAGTRSGAEVLRLAREVGTLESGKIADFVAVAGNPLQDISAVRDVVAVAKEGELLVRPGQEVIPATDA